MPYVQRVPSFFSTSDGQTTLRSKQIAFDMYKYIDLHITAGTEQRTRSVISGGTTLETEIASFGRKVHTGSRTLHSHLMY